MNYPMLQLKHLGFTQGNSNFEGHCDEVEGTWS